MTRSVADAAITVLETAQARDKAAAAHRCAAAWRAGELDLGAASTAIPDRPARPARPVLVAPSQVPRRRLHSPAGRIALLHALAHIEFNAIDLAFDLVARFAADPLIADARRQDFVSDWITVGDDEARHFGMVADRLAGLGAAYGDHGAHDGLWDAALATRDHLAARLAIAPLVLEARGLDVTPGMIDRLTAAGDRESACILRIIYNEEIGHVAAGARWFSHVCAAQSRDPAGYFRELVARYFRGHLKPPFNDAARRRAGLPPDFYQTLTETGSALA